MPTVYTVGVDIGATKIVAGLVRGNKVVKTERLPTYGGKKPGKSATLTTLRQAIDAVWHPKVKGIGLGLAGTTDPDRGFFYRGANYPKSFRNIYVARELKSYRVPIAIDNDVHCFALGEALFGAGRGHRHVFGMTLGTGLGGALVIDGQVYRGRDNVAGEIGHTTVAMNTSQAVCGMGGIGHLESFATGTGLARMIADRYSKPFPTEELAKRAAAGDRKAAEVIDIAGRAFAVGCANVVQTLNPDIIIVGGGLARMQALWKVMRREFRGLLPYPQVRSTPVVRSKLSHEAGVLGAANMF
ncbi:ROK family protein [Patescibacteria group bacterium]